jgi:hypothetical protein
MSRSAARSQEREISTGTDYTSGEKRKQRSGCPASLAPLLITFSLYFFYTGWSTEDNPKNFVSLEARGVTRQGNI